MSCYPDNLYGAEYPGDYGIRVRGRTATVVQNRGGGCGRSYIEEIARATPQTGRTGRQAAEKLAARLGWDLDRLGTTRRVW